MKKLFKGLTLLAVTCSAVTLMTACDTAPTTSTPAATVDVFTPVEFDTTKEVTIKFYSTMGTSLKSTCDIYLEDFKEMYPNITVEHSSIGGYDDVLSQCKTELSVGEGPDITYCYADHVASYNKTGKVIRLDNLIADETYGLTAEQQADFIQGYYEEGRSFGDGYMYTLPFSKSTEVLYYNKKFFADNNLTVPTTWDEMETVCRAIKKIDPNSIPLGYDSPANWFITMTEQYNSPYTSADKSTGHFLFNNDQNKAFMKEFKSWYDEGLVTTQDIYGAYTSGLFTATGENQKCYMCIGSSAGATHQVPSKDDSGNYPFETGITSIPQVDAENNGKVISQGPSLCMFNQGDDQKVMAAWLLMKFLTTNASFQAQFSIASGYVPVIKSVADIKVYADHLAKTGNANISAVSAKLCLEQEEYYFTSPAFNGSSEARIAVGDMVNNIFTTKGDDIDAIINKAFEDCIYECKYQVGLA